MNLSERDKKHIWHPFEMPESPAALAVTSASGTKLTLENGQQIIDAISSWWVTIHGHAHPAITKAIKEQAEKLHHVMFAGFTHQPAVELAEKLISKLPGNQHKLFFSDNGSTAVEVAIKLCIQYWKNNGIKKTKIIALQNSYHGDTFGAMSAGARSIFSKPFDDYLFDVKFLPSIHLDPTEAIEQLNILLKDNDINCFIYEPLVQGAGGINIYPAEVLDKLILACKNANIPTIADEVMTGFGRTGKWFASDHCVNKPDIICLSKALTGGTLPMGITSCSKKIFDAFDHTSRDKGFFHGHTYTGNPLACAAANASFDLLNTADAFQQIGKISNSHQAFVALLNNHPKVINPRSLGTILAFDINPQSVNQQQTSIKYINPIRDKIMEYCLEQKVLIRPLGDTVYIMPPYCISESELLFVYDVLLGCLDTL
jgi:adenosylmethionine-8-amino-7-oxononanoate aminotransferase